MFPVRLSVVAQLFLQAGLDSQRLANRPVCVQLLLSLFFPLQPNSTDDWHIFSWFCLQYRWCKKYYKKGCVRVCTLHISPPQYSCSTLMITSFLFVCFVLVCRENGRNSVANCHNHEVMRDYLVTTQYYMSYMFTQGGTKRVISNNSWRKWSVCWFVDIVNDSLIY